MEKLHEELITALFADDPVSTASGGTPRAPLVTLVLYAQDEVRRLHSIGADINMRDYMSEGHGATPLQYSILYNRLGASSAPGISAFPSARARSEHCF